MWTKYQKRKAWINTTPAHIKNTKNSSRTIHWKSKPSPSNTSLKLSNTCLLLQYTELLACSSTHIWIFYSVASGMLHSIMGDAMSTSTQTLEFYFSNNWIVTIAASERSAFLSLLLITVSYQYEFQHLPHPPASLPLQNPSSYLLPHIIAQDPSPQPPYICNRMGNDKEDIHSSRPIIHNRVWTRG